MGRLRTFIAVDIAAEQRERASRLVQKMSIAGSSYRWTEPENLHITLNFLGNVEETEITDVCRIVREKADQFSGFELSLLGAGAFPNIDKPRIVWVGIDRGADQLIDLQAELAQSLESLGYPPEARQYRPHLTLGRIKRAARMSAEMSELLHKQATFDGGVSFVDELVVYSSFLDRSGPTYTAISRSPFK